MVLLIITVRAKFKLETFPVKLQIFLAKNKSTKVTYYSEETLLSDVVLKIAYEELSTLTTDFSLSYSL